MLSTYSMYTTPCVEPPKPRQLTPDQLKVWRALRAEHPSGSVRRLILDQETCGLRVAPL